MTIRPAVVVAAVAVDRHDPRVLETGGNLSLASEPFLKLRIFGVVCLDLFQRDLAIEFALPGHKDLAQAAASILPDDFKTAC